MTARKCRCLCSAFVENFVENVVGNFSNFLAVTYPEGIPAISPALRATSYAGERRCGVLPLAKRLGVRQSCRFARKLPLVPVISSHPTTPPLLDHLSRRSYIFRRRGARPNSSASTPTEPFVPQFSQTRPHNIELLRLQQCQKTRINMHNRQTEYPFESRFRPLHSRAELSTRHPPRKGKSNLLKPSKRRFSFTRPKTGNFPVNDARRFALTLILK